MGNDREPAPGWLEKFKSQPLIGLAHFLLPGWLRTFILLNLVVETYNYLEH